MVQPVLTKAVIHPAKAAAMCTACHNYAHPSPPISPLPIRPFLLAQTYLKNRLRQLITCCHAANVRKCQKASSVVKGLKTTAYERKCQYFISHTFSGVCDRQNTILIQARWLMLPASTRAVTNHWTGLLEWTSGMDYWTDLFCTKNHFYGLRITRSLTCKNFRSINNSIIYFTAQNHTYLK